MALRKPNKSVYKVYIKGKDKYYSAGSKSKSTWNSLNWAMSAAEDAERYYGVPFEDVEIHEFPITEAIKHSYLDLIEAEKEAKREKEEKRKLAEIKKEEQRQIQNAKAVLLQAKENMANAMEFLKSKGLDVELENLENL